MTVAVVIQARMGSTRLPGKMMRICHGRTLLSRVIESCQQAARPNVVIVATTIRRADDVLAEHAKLHKVVVYRGSDEDVLGRICGAATTMGVSGVVRVCGDSPCMSAERIDGLIDTWESHHMDYGGYTLDPEGVPAILAKKGSFPEFISTRALQTAAEEDHREAAREHVTLPWYNTEENEWHCVWISAGHIDEYVKLDVDTEDDLTNMDEYLCQMLE